MQDKKSLNVDLVLNKLRDALGIKTDLALAQFLEVKANTISSWRSRSTLDFELIITKCDNIDFDWLFSQNANKQYQSNDICNEVVNEPNPELKAACKLCREKDKRIEELNKTVNIQNDFIQCLKAQLPETQKRQTG